MSSIKQAQDIKALELRVSALERRLDAALRMEQTAAPAQVMEREPLKLKGRV